MWRVVCFVLMVAAGWGGAQELEPDTLEQCRAALEELRSDVQNATALLSIENSELQFTVETLEVQLNQTQRVHAEQLQAAARDNQLALANCDRRTVEDENARLRRDNEALTREVERLRAAQDGVRAARRDFPDLRGEVLLANTAGPLQHERPLPQEEPVQEVTSPEPPRGEDETRSTPQTGQIDARSTPQTGQIEARLTPQTGQIEARSTPQTGQIDARSTPQTSQIEARLTPQTGQIEAKPTPFTDQNEARSTPHTGQIGVRPDSHTGQIGVRQDSHTGQIGVRLDSHAREDISRSVVRVRGGYRERVHPQRVPTQRRVATRAPVKNTLIESNLKMTNLGGHYYYFSGEHLKLSWSEALKFCRSRGLQLVSIEDAEENERIKQYLTSSNYNYGSYNGLWLGGVDEPPHDLKLVWSGTGRPVEFTDWGGSPPDSLSGTMNCLVMWGSREEDRDTELQWCLLGCTSQRKFICEK